MPDLCVIIPCYNESERIRISTFSEYLEQNDIYYCFVNDGSKDNTLEVLESFRSTNTEKILVVDQPQNKGKAEAVRLGINKSNAWKNFDYLAYFDADLAVPLQDINLLHNFIKANDQFSLIMGTRLKRLGAEIKRSPSRHFFGRIFATFASNLFKIDAYDTQCGLKVFRESVVSEVFDKPFYSKWFFDIEIILRMKNLGGGMKNYTAICEVPLSAWEEVDGSKLKLIDFITVPFELLRLHRKYKNI